LKAIKLSTAGVTTYAPTTGTGAVVSLPWPLSFNPIGSAAVANVNSAKTAVNSAGTSCAMTLASVTAGNTNVVIAAMRTTTSTVSSISDGASTYTRRAAI